jgi:hypothetical protein
MRVKANAKNRLLMPVELICKAEGLPMPTPEYQFAKDDGRRWRFDWCWVDQKVVLEVEGGVWTAGRHTRPKGFLSDLEKYNRATQLGYRVFRCTPSTIHLGMELVKAQLQSGSSPASGEAAEGAKA